MTSQWIRRIVLAGALTLCAAGSAFTQSTTVILVRHAEKVDDSADPALSEAGNARARALADALADAGVTAILTTQFERTRMTAAPLGERLGIVPAIVTAAGRAHAAEVAARVREHADGTVVVVGHSNTVGAIIRALGGPDVGDIADAEYDNLFVLTIEADEARLIRTRYGSAQVRHPS
jgi:broad specificity phosphatase PhoE